MAIFNVEPIGNLVGIHRMTVTNLKIFDYGGFVVYESVKTPVAVMDIG